MRELEKAVWGVVWFPLIRSTITCDRSLLCDLCRDRQQQSWIGFAAQTTGIQTVKQIADPSVMANAGKGAFQPFKWGKQPAQI
jgi:hypothetical protein